MRLWHDLSGENGKEKQKETFNFLETMYKKCDKIVVAKNSKFVEKEKEFSKIALDILKHKIAKLYFGLIRFNSQKCEEVDIENIEEEIDFTGINPDDMYLLKIYYKIKAPIITTDIKLKNSLENKNIECKLRDDFLKEYFKPME